MEIEQTLFIIKPDAVKNHLVDEIIVLLDKEGLRVIKRLSYHLERKEAADFYHMHKERSFFNSLLDYMTSGTVEVCLIEGQDAVMKTRKIMGATDPKKADEGTIRALYGTDIERNCVHGSDSLESARREITFFNLAKS